MVMEATATAPTHKPPVNPTAAAPMEVAPTATAPMMIGTHKPAPTKPQSAVGSHPAPKAHALT